MVYGYTTIFCSQDINNSKVIYLKINNKIVCCIKNLQNANTKIIGGFKKYSGRQNKDEF